MFFVLRNQQHFLLLVWSHSKTFRLQEPNSQYGGRSNRSADFCKVLTLFGIPISLKSPFNFFSVSLLELLLLLLLFTHFVGNLKTSICLFDFQVYVLKRPHVDEFLQRVGELFECVLFTASLSKVCLTFFVSLEVFVGFL